MQTKSIGMEIYAVYYHNGSSHTNSGVGDKHDMVTRNDSGYYTDCNVCYTVAVYSYIHVQIRSFYCAFSICSERIMLES